MAITTAQAYPPRSRFQSIEIQSPSTAQSENNAGPHFAARYCAVPVSNFDGLEVAGIKNTPRSTDSLSTLPPGGVREIRRQVQRVSQW